MVVDYSEFRLENARRLGFVTCNPGSENLLQRATAEFGSQRGYPAEKCGARLYVDCVGVPSVIRDFAALARPGAEISIVGVHKESASLNFTEVAFNNWHIRGCGTETTENLLLRILEMMRSGRYDLSSLVTHEFPVDQISEAITLAAQPDRAQKVCVSF